MLHQWLHRINNIGVLLVGRQVQNHICLRDEVFISADGEAVLTGTKERGTLLCNRCLTERVGNVQPAIA